MSVRLKKLDSGNVYFMLFEDLVFNYVTGRMCRLMIAN